MGLKMIHVQTVAQRGLADENSLDRLQKELNYMLRKGTNCDPLFTGITFSTAPQAVVSGMSIHWPNQPDTALAKPGLFLEPRLEIKDVQLGEFKAHADGIGYQANLMIRTVQGEKAHLRTVPMSFETETVDANTRRIVKCSDGTFTPGPAPSPSSNPSNEEGPKFDFVCEQVKFNRPAGAGSEPSSNSASYIKRKCPNSKQVITSCNAILHNNGLRVCGTTGMVGRDSDGKAYCTTYGCTAGNNNEFWQVVINCCEIIEKYYW